jgi:hypothetical protein
MNAIEDLAHQEKCAALHVSDPYDLDDRRRVSALPHLTSAYALSSNSACCKTWWSPLARPGQPFLPFLKEVQAVPVQ